MEEIEAWIGRAFGDRLQFNDAFVTSHRWLVVPVESGLHFDENDAVQLANAVQSAKPRRLLVVLLEKLVDVEDKVPVEVSRQGLLSFSQKYGHFNCMLVPDDFSFAIVCTIDDYYLVAGPPDFVRLALGKEVSEARTEFYQFANNVDWSLHERTLLLGVHERYKDL